MQTHPAPFLIKKVPNFKDFVKGYLHEGGDKLVGHSKPLQFRFYMSEGVPLMQYKIHPTKSDWSPDEGIELWKRGENGETLLPTGAPKVLPYFEYMKDHEKVIEGLQTFVNWWKSFIDSKGKESAYANWIMPVIEYWEQMIIALRTPCVEQEYVMQDFWPRSLSSPVVALEDAFEDEDNFGMNENEDHYCGSARNKPKEEFNPQIDVSKGNFVLVRPSSSMYPIWLGVAISDVDKEKESETFSRVKIQYWAPITKQKNANEVDVYKDCWKKTWRCNEKDPQRWEHANSIVWSWTPRTNNASSSREAGQSKLSKTIKIPKSVVEKAKLSLKLAGHVNDGSASECDDNILKD